MLGLAYHATLPAPTLSRLIGQIVEHSRCLAGGLELQLRLLQLFAKNPLQSGVSRQSEHVIHMVRFAPAHQVLSAKTAVASHDDSHRRPRNANPFDDLRQLLHRTRRAVDVRWQTRQLWTTKGTKREPHRRYRNCSARQTTGRGCKNQQSRMGFSEKSPLVPIAQKGPTRFGFSERCSRRISARRAGCTCSHQGVCGRSPSIA